MEMVLQLLVFLLQTHLCSLQTGCLRAPQSARRTQIPRALPQRPSPGSCCDCRDIGDSVQPQQERLRPWGGGGCRLGLRCRAVLCRPFWLEMPGLLLRSRARGCPNAWGELQAKGAL